MEKRLGQKFGKRESEKAKSLVWDCGSSLYDSFELKSFERQLDSAITASRTLSMPHLTDRRGRPPPQPQQPTPQPFSKMSSKISKSFQKFVKSMFRPRQRSKNTLFRSDQGFYVVYKHDMSGVLSTIPEVPEMNVADFDGLSPEIKSLVTRTASQRVTATSIGVSYA